MTLLLLAAALLSSPFTFAKSSQILELQRVNFKPEKKLVYELDYNPSSCEINKEKPFIVYYKDNATGEREADFSKNSEKFFGPRDTAVSTRQVALEFKGFDEIEQAINVRATLTAYLEKNGEKCSAFAEISYAKKRYMLERIEIQVKKALGIPNGVEWIMLKGRDNGAKVADCVAGSCR